MVALFYFSLFCAAALVLFLMLSYKVGSDKPVRRPYDPGRLSNYASRSGGYYYQPEETEAEA